MTILEYIKTHNLSRPEFAKKVGVVHQAVSHWINKRNYPNRKTANKIERMTKGEITLQDIYG